MDVATNYVLPDGLLNHQMRPAGCQVANNVFTMITTRYYVTSTSQPDTDELAAYLAHRADLFRTWCLPSMAAQTTPPNVWLILVSAWARPHLGDVLDDLPDFARIITVPNGQALTTTAKRWLADHNGLWPTKRHLISARVDNDDAVARDYVDVLAKWTTRAKPATPTTLVLPFGLQHDTASGRTGIDMHTTNHFSAVLHARGQPYLGPFGTGHTEIYRDHAWTSRTRGVHRILTRDPMWVEVLHDANVANHPRPGGPPLPLTTDQWHARFAVRPPAGPLTDPAAADF